MYGLSPFSEEKRQALSCPLYVQLLDSNMIFLHDSCFLFTAGQLIIMVTASVVQVMTIRHLFGDQSAKSHNMKLAT